MVPLDHIVNKLAYPSGMLFSFSSTKCYRGVMGGVLLISVFYIVTEGAFYISNLDDLNESTACLGTLSFVITSLVRLVLVIVNNSRLKCLILSIRKIYESPPSTHSESLVAERRTNKYIAIFGASAYLTITFMTLSPLVNMYLEYRATGEVVHTRWELPYKMLFPFDFKTPTKYFVLYLCVAISTIPYLSPILAVDALFLGCGLHIAAFFKHLQVQALSLGDDAAENETRTTFSQDQFLRKTRLFVEQHNKIIDLVQGMQEIFGGVFIVQYVGAMFIMCTQAYLSTLNLESGYVLPNLLYMFTITLELFIYTYVGSQIMAESEQLATVIWSLNWHSKEPTIRFYYQQILQRCQKPCRILALNWLPSSLTSFRTVLSISYQMFNLLRNLSGAERRAVN